MGGGFLLPPTREVMPMYMTWEMFFQFCGLVIAIVGLVLSNQNNKNR
jgi:hypothetical protein